MKRLSAPLLRRVCTAALTMLLTLPLFAGNVSAEQFPASRTERTVLSFRDDTGMIPSARKLAAVSSARSVKSSAAVSGGKKLTGTTVTASKGNALPKVVVNEEAVYQGGDVKNVLLPSAPGTQTEEKAGKAVIDYSNVSDGYVGVKTLGSADKVRQLRITAPDGGNSDYVLPASGDWLYFPLTAGNGAYTVTLYECVANGKYAKAASIKIDVSVKDEFLPYLLPHYLINYNASSKAVKVAAYLASVCKTDLETVQSVYNYIVTNVSYDRKRAASAAGSYVPDLDDVMTAKSGICFDYAALMCAMLRSQGIPAKMVFGYSDKEYHAWVNIYTKETGWVNSVFRFSGTWKLLDPTAASTSNNSSAVNAYVEKAEQYQPKFIY